MLNQAKLYLQLARPHQYVKNGFVWLPIFFGVKLGDLWALEQTLIAFVAFCLAAGGVYVLNDLKDIQEDRRHPYKKNRPLARIAAAGLGSFLAVLKLFGPENANYLSFPLEGYTLALDFKIQNRLFPFLNELDRIVLDHGGRLYLTKDVRMSREVFQKGYPRGEQFTQIREHYHLNEKFNSVQSKRLGV